MALIQKQFSLNYELNGGTIRVQQGGEFTDENSGKRIQYSPSVKITCTNVEQSDTIDPESGFANNVERKVVFKIPCDDIKTAGSEANALTSLFIKNQPIYLEAGLPVRKVDGSFEVTVSKIKNLEDKKSAK